MSPRETKTVCGRAEVLPNEALQELVDSIVGAVDVDRVHEVARVRLALDSLHLADAFTAELRQSGVSSLTWGRCEFCSDVIDSLNISEEVAA